MLTHLKWLAKYLWRDTMGSETSQTGTLVLVSGRPFFFTDNALMARFVAKQMADGKNIISTSEIMINPPLENVASASVNSATSKAPAHKQGDSDRRPWK